jgi:hypothetical protein
MWKTCKECPNYEVSSYGEVRRKDTGKILQQKLDRNNNLIVHFSMGSRNNTKYYSVHRLVAEAFIPNPDNLPWVRHIDNNLINNEASNLEWIEDKWKNTQLHGASAHNSKLTKEQVRYCRDMYKPRDKQYGLSALAELFDVSKSTMSYILNNKTYN